MNNSDFQAKFREFPPFSFLSDDQFNELLSSSEIRYYEPGARLLRPDEISNELFFLVSGRLRTLGISPLGLGQVTLGVEDDNDLVVG